eukprot:scaffold680417_cov45-Prasinocladus_malaysianus.AAC.1
MGANSSTGDAEVGSEDMMPGLVLRGSPRDMMSSSSMMITCMAWSALVGRVIVNVVDKAATWSSDV